MKNFLIAAGLGLLLALPAAAASPDEPEKRKLIAQIMQKVNLKRVSEMQMAGMMAMIQGQVPKMVADAGVPAAQREKASGILRANLGALQGQMTTIILDVTADSYANTFTVAELKELLAFYNTPTGNKLMQELPRLQGEGMKVGQEAGKRLFMEATCNSFARFRKEGIRTTRTPPCK
ncbi:MAG: hypothetical protein K0Q68_2946 [Moraxellaceae bacterium]|jgi:hypothetical protein|nr:hypothetical protein [Moraxellaceae bacterium]